RPTAHDEKRNAQWSPLKQIPELWFPLPLEMSMKTHCFITPNWHLPNLRFVTVLLLTWLAVPFTSLTTLAVFIEPPPPKQYTEIDLGGINGLNINQAGQIVGNLDVSPTLTHAAFWASSQSAPIDLGTLDGLNSVAFGINANRQIVGYAFNADFSTELPLLWASPHSAPVQLPGLAPGFGSEVYDINLSGQIVGQLFSSAVSVDAAAVCWPDRKSAPTYLPQLSDQFPISVAT